MIYRLPEIKTIYNRLKASAKKRNIPFTLELIDLHYIDWPISCPILGIPLKFNRGKQEDSSYSFDRIDSTKGYEIDNLVIISWKANRLKNNASAEELELISNFYKSVKISTKK
jgi:hypothetical protein